MKTQNLVFEKIMMQNNPLNSAIWSAWPYVLMRNITIRLIKISLSSKVQKWSENPNLKVQEKNRNATELFKEAIEVSIIETKTGLSGDLCLGWV